MVFGLLRANPAAYAQEGDNPSFGASFNSESRAEKGKRGHGSLGEETDVSFIELAPVTFECARDAGESFSVPLALILLIMDTESGVVGKESSNRNGSKDLGPMQINSLWLPKLETLGISREDIRDNGCVNVAVASWILREHLIETGDPLKALARYHSKNPERARIYTKAALERASHLDVEKTLTRANGKLETPLAK
jgi:soluble lytic murein transglycosylase-like protein